HSLVKLNPAANFTDAYIQSHAWRFDFSVNSDKYGLALKTGNPTLINAVSIAAFQNSGHNFAWFRANYPGWLLYNCDRTPLILDDSGSVSPDFTDPGYVDFKWTTEFMPAIQSAGSVVQAIVLDGAFLQNEFRTSSTGMPSSAACGIYDAQ